LVQEILKLKINVVSMENISGHGWLKIMRSKKALRYRIEKMLPVPEVFSFYADQLGVNLTQLLSVFNLGAGFMIITESKGDALAAVKTAENLGYSAIVAGLVESSEKGREVIVEPLDAILTGEGFVLSKG
jgi:phosphoribosylformylglycinamidine cyclo-ligase